VKANSGDALRVAFIHGFAGDARAWDDVIAGLPWVEPVRVDLPGHGAPAVASWDDGLAAVAAASGSVGAVVGYSLGARVALGLVATDRAPAAILIGVNPGLTTDAERHARAASDAVWAAMLRDRGVVAFADAWETQPLFATQAHAPAERVIAKRARRRALDPEGLAKSLETMGLAAMPDYRAAIRARAARLHLIVGGDDTRFLAIARALVAANPALPLDVIAGSGHDVALERPAELARAIARALARLVTRAG